MEFLEARFKDILGISGGYREGLSFAFFFFYQRKGIMVNPWHISIWRMIDVKRNPSRFLFFTGIIRISLRIFIYISLNSELCRKRKEKEETDWKWRFILDLVVIL